MAFSKTKVYSSKINFYTFEALVQETYHTSPLRYILIITYNIANINVQIKVFKNLKNTCCKNHILVFYSDGCKSLLFRSFHDQINQKSDFFE